MSLTTAQRTALASEINTNPLGLAYSGKTNQQDADLLNTPGASSQTIDSGVVPSYQIWAAIVSAEWTALSAIQQQQLRDWVSGGYVDTSSSTVRAVFGALFGAQTTTRANLMALTARPASRAEILFGRGTIVLAEDVSAALNRT